MTRTIRLLPAFMTVGVWTLASRVLGFVRDILIAATLGAGPVAEAFLIAFALPNMFRRFFAEGAFNTAFVPMFAKRVEAGDNPLGFARQAFSGLALILLVLSALAHLAMPWLVLAMASGFAGDARFDLAVDYGRIAFPYILFISLAALASGVLNATGRFAVAAAAPVLLNIIFIGALKGADWMGWDAGRALVWAVPVAGIAQLALVWWAARSAGFPLIPLWPRLSPEMRRLAIVAAPAALAGGVVQINLLVGRQVASFTEGAVAWLSYADRLYQLPLGVVGIAIGIVLLPSLTRQLQAGKETEARDSINRALEFTLVLILPAAVALFVIPGALVSVLFERGAFEAEDTLATAWAVAIYGLGLPAFVLQKVYAPVFFAREDTRTPFRFALVSMVVNAGLAVGLMPVTGYLAAAIGTTLSGWVMVGLLWWGAKRVDPELRWDARLRRVAPRMALAALAMGLALLALSWVLTDLLSADGWRYGALALLVVAGAGVYGAFVLVTGALGLADLKRALRRGGSSTSA
ncbi:MAG: murein biosynthesis integral membrane protein MurJ [Pseudomonadota bacterium]